MRRELFYKAFFIVMIGIAFLNSGCATMKSWVGMGETEKPMRPVVTTPKFSDNPNYLANSNRQYKRMTKSRMEDESELHAQAGSMWVNEGQGAYLFAQNKTRRDGDVLNVKIEGPAQKQVETKVSVIKKLLKQLEEEETQRKLEANPPPVATQDENAKLADGKPAVTREPASAPKPVEKEEPLNIEAVPTKVVERLADGNYRVRGMQPFMIGKREYKVIVTGMIRPEDFNDEGISSNKLLDPQFDVVSLRKKNTELQ